MEYIFCICIEICLFSLCFGLGVSKSQSESGYSDRGGNSKRGSDSRSSSGAKGDKWSQRGDRGPSKPAAKGATTDRAGKRT